jgi:hypothetical protein
LGHKGTESYGGLPSNISCFCYQRCPPGADVPILYDRNLMMEIILHESGHLLGIWDMRIPDRSCGGSSAPPTLRCAYNDKMYWDWRMTFAGTPYDVHKDSHVSVMDYDANGNAEWNVPQIGWWGRPFLPTEQNQPYYFSQYDVSIVQDKYGAPAYLPVITMKLCLTWAGADWGGNQGACPFVTNSWDDANGKCRSFQMPSDVRDLEGLVMSTGGIGRVQVSLFKKMQNGGLWYDHCISTAATVPGFTRFAVLGYWFTTASNVTLTIGTTARTAAAIPVYQQYNATIDRHHVSMTNDPAPGWVNQGIVAYIFPASAITW